MSQFNRGQRVNFDNNGTKIAGVVVKRYTRGEHKGLFEIKGDDDNVYEYVDESQLSERKRGRKSLASTLSIDDKIELANKLKAELIEKPTRSRQKAIRRQLRSLGYTGGINAVIE